ncbi:MAG: hypothetical protein Q9217_001952 [Psora testacea]
MHIACSPGPYAQIERLKVAKEARTKLKDLYGGDTYVTKEATYFALDGLRSDQFKDLYEYLVKFKEYANKLHDMGDAIPADYQAAISKRGLPEHMKGFISTPNENCRTKKESIDLDYVSTTLVNNEIYWK